jgi:DNA-binding transcriptional LysR family regulator
MIVVSWATLAAFVLAGTAAGFLAGYVVRSYMAFREAEEVERERDRYRPGG